MCCPNQIILYTLHTTYLAFSDFRLPNHISTFRQLFSATARETRTFQNSSRPQNQIRSSSLTSVLEVRVLILIFRKVKQELPRCCKLLESDSRRNFVIFLSISSSLFQTQSQHKKLVTSWSYISHVLFVSHHFCRMDIQEFIAFRLLM